MGRGQSGEQALIRGEGQRFGQLSYDVTTKVDQAHNILRGLQGVFMASDVIMTSSNQHLDVAAGYAAGANGFVIKPVGFERLIESAHAVGVYWGLFNQPPSKPA